MAGAQVPARATGRTEREVIFVAMGAGGGIGRVEQATIAALAILARRAGMRPLVLQLAPSSAERSPSPLPIYSAGGSRARLARALLSAVLRHRHAFVLFGHVNLAPLALLLPRVAARPRYGVWCYGIDVWSPLRRSRRRALRHARLLLSISSYTTERLIRVQGADPARVRLVPCAYSLPGEARGPVDEAAAPRLLSVSRLDAGEARKGIDTVIRTMPRLIAHYPSLRYDIIGRGADMPRLQALATDLGVREHVVFHGFVPDADLRAAYTACDVFVLPSGKEGFGIVYLEAMAEGRPVVAARAGGVPDVVVDGETGLLAPFGDVDAVCGALRTLLADPALRQRMGAAGRARVLTQFSLDRFVGRLESALSARGATP